MNPLTTPNAGTTTIPRIEFNLRYPGQHFDKESNLSYNYFRSYRSQDGRYTQNDPIGLEGGWNRFGYVGGNAFSRVDPNGLDWIYQQSTGNLYHQPTNPSSTTLMGTGYAGNGLNLNNPTGQSVPNSGPIPQGTYTFGPQRSSAATGRGIMDLLPDSSNRMFGRSAFQMHGDNGQGNRSASNGCIVMPRSIRDAVGNSGDATLRVVP